MSPREKLISIYRKQAGSNYKLMFMSKMPEELLQLKLEIYVNSIYEYLNNNSFNYVLNLKININPNKIDIFNYNTLLKTYSIEDVTNFNTEISLSMGLFIDWGYLLSKICTVQTEQLTLVI